MKKLRLLGLVGLMVCGFVFSCTLPMEVIEPKINGVKLNPTFKKITDMVVDSNDNIYILDNNVIKKLDSKGKLTIIGGNEKPEENFNENMNGDVKTAKFGKIEKIQYVENEKTLYFVEYFDNKSNSIEKIQRIVNNKLETLKLEILNSFSNTHVFSINISKSGYIYLAVQIYPEKNMTLYKLNTNMKEIKFQNLSFEGVPSKIFEDDNSNLYFLDRQLVSIHLNTKIDISSINIKLNNKVEQIRVSFPSNKAGFFEDTMLFDSKNENVYFQGDNTIYKLGIKVFEAKFLSTKNSKLETLELENKDIVGYIPNNLKISDLNDKKNIIYAFDEKNIYKINIGR